MNKIANAAVIAAMFTTLGCGNYSGGNQVSSERAENKEQPNFGSATDISSATNRNTNSMNAADNGLGGPMQRASGNYQSQPLLGQTSDAELAKMVKVALTTGSMGTTGVIAEDQLTKIDVSVQDGIVTLRGAVSSDAEKNTIGKQVAGMKGVSSVRNELTVGGRSVEDKPLDPLIPRGPGNQ